MTNWSLGIVNIQTDFQVRPLVWFWRLQGKFSYWPAKSNGNHRLYVLGFFEWYWEAEEGGEEMVINPRLPKYLVRLGNLQSCLLSGRSDWTAFSQAVCVLSQLSEAKTQEMKRSNSVWVEFIHLSIQWIWTNHDKIPGKMLIIMQVTFINTTLESKLMRIIKFKYNRLENNQI